MSPCDGFVEHMFLSYLRRHHIHLTNFACGQFQLEPKSLYPTQRTQRGVSMLCDLCPRPMARLSNASQTCHAPPASSLRTCSSLSQPAACSR